MIDTRDGLTLHERVAVMLNRTRILVQELSVDNDLSVENADAFDIAIDARRFARMAQDALRDKRYMTAASFLIDADRFADRARNER